MNIEFKESVFRYIFPACLFWSPFIIVMFNEGFYKYHPLIEFTDNIGLFLVLLLATGIVISGVGGIVVRIIDLYKKPRWSKPDEELEYWDAIAEKEEFTRNKIDRRWNFYVTNLNSCIAVFFSLIVLFVYFRCLSALVIIVLFLLLIVFGFLTKLGYQTMLAFDKELKK